MILLFTFLIFGGIAVVLAMLYFVAQSFYDNDEYYSTKNDAPALFVERIPGVLTEMERDNKAFRAGQ